MRESTWDRSRSRREHIESLEKTLRLNPKDVTLRGHIRQLKRAWGMVRSGNPIPDIAAA